MNKKNKQSNRAYFAGGCFWCLEAIYQRLSGVEAVVSGYASGEDKKSSDELGSMGKMGLVETVEVSYDPEVISYKILLEIYFAFVDPTTYDKQGYDVGPAYRSVIFYKTSQQKKQIEEYIKKLEADKVFDSKIVTEVKPLGRFTKAESYHQNFYEDNPAQPYCHVIISPKIEKLRYKYKSLLKEPTQQ